MPVSMTATPTPRPVARYQALFACTAVTVGWDSSLYVFRIVGSTSFAGPGSHLLVVVVASVTGHVETAPTGSIELALMLVLSETALTPRLWRRRAAARRLSLAPNPLVTRGVGDVTRPPRTRTSRFPAAGDVPFFIWMMYSPVRGEAARAVSEPANSSRQIAADRATANRSRKTMVSSAMLDSFLLD